MVSRFCRWVRMAPVVTRWGRTASSAGSGDADEAGERPKVNSAAVTATTESRDPRRAVSGGGRGGERPRIVLTGDRPWGWGGGRGKQAEGGGGWHRKCAAGGAEEG